MKNKFKKITGVIVVFFLLILVFLPTINSMESFVLDESFFNLSGEENSIYLIRSENYLYLETSENVSTFRVRYSFPPDHGFQTPIYLEILEDTDAYISCYKIENDADGINKIINFTISSLNKDETPLIHFNSWILVEKNDFDDMPDSVNIPNIGDLPEDTKKWLSPSEVIQSDNILIKIRAKILKGFNTDLVKLAGKTASFVKNHRYLLFIIQFRLQTILQYPPQDAVTTLLVNGECPGRSNLGCALFRANGVPARVVLANPTRYDFWFEMHYMLEYYLPSYGWVLSEVHDGKTPYGPENQLILRICSTDDENNTAADNIYPRMKCLEQWMWIDNEMVSPYYLDLKEGTRIKAFNEQIMDIDVLLIDEIFSLTRSVFAKYEQFLGENLVGDNLEHFTTATDYQELAIEKLIDLDEPYGYLYFMIKADSEYNKISI